MMRIAGPLVLLTIAGTAHAQSLYLIQPASVEYVRQPGAQLEEWSMISVPPPVPRVFAKHDLITIIISERQDLKNEEKTDLKKTTDLTQQLTDFDIFPNAFDPLPSLSANSSDNLSGTANYEKKGNFQARVTAIVMDTLPNGNLIVKGRREIRIDDEVKLIEFSGIVRRYDVKPNNTVESELVADARVSYVGKGPLTNSTNRVGLGKWFHNAITWLWPF